MYRKLPIFLPIVKAIVSFSRHPKLTFRRDLKLTIASQAVRDRLKRVHEILETLQRRRVRQDEVYQELQQTFQDLFFEEEIGNIFFFFFEHEVHDQPWLTVSKRAMDEKILQVTYLGLVLHPAPIQDHEQAPDTENSRARYGHVVLAGGGVPALEGRADGVHEVLEQLGALGRRS